MPTRMQAVLSSILLAALLIGCGESTGGAPRTWVDAFRADHPDWFYEKELPLEDRKAGKLRAFSFEDDT